MSWVGRTDERREDPRPLKQVLEDFLGTKASLNEQEDFYIKKAYADALQAQRDLFKAEESHDFNAPETEASSEAEYKRMLIRNITEQDIKRRTAHPLRGISENKPLTFLQALPLLEFIIATDLYHANLQSVTDRIDHDIMDIIDRSEAVLDQIATLNHAIAGGATDGFPRAEREIMLKTLKDGGEIIAEVIKIEENVVASGKKAISQGFDGHSAREQAELRRQAETQLHTDQALLKVAQQMKDNYMPVKNKVLGMINL